MSVDASHVEVKATLPSPNLYNKAVLEAFQRVLSKNEVVQKRPDLVVFLAGSFSKGLGHYFSDSDNLTLTDTDPVDKDIPEHIQDSIDPEFRKLVNNDPRFAELRRYTTLGDTIYERYEKKYDKLRKIDPALSAHFYGNFGRRSAVLQRAYRNPNVKIPDDGKVTARIGDSFFGDDEYVSETTESICSDITNFDISKQHAPTRFHNLILVLSSEAGLNAYEVTPGTLHLYQDRIVKAIRELRDTDINRYQEFMRVMQDNYLNYTRSAGFDFIDHQLHVKSPLLKRAIERTETGEPLLEFYRKFQQFPEIEQLEAHFKIQS